VELLDVLTPAASAALHGRSVEGLQNHSPQVSHHHPVDAVLVDRLKE
jgi:hypothetical protein